MAEEVETMMEEVGANGAGAPDNGGGEEHELLTREDVEAFVSKTMEEYKRSEEKVDGLWRIIVVIATTCNQSTSFMAPECIDYLLAS
ncbi:expressed unknown protein [Seminavis robusta]|uniref:Uncharacterized protein n=1 Tax=Seminavis robusta TaxID=568900 RepID=A0A9N8EWY7_9STRA|nr:expressed unknown protein [Seminavis robusta]|eukprot:Sro1944_g306930.1 n/a (87) ;mRNA; r:12515-12858